MAAIPFDRFEALTFDCYGTIVDWESGLLAALRELAARAGAECPDDDQLLSLHARLEPQAQRGAFRPYREVLREVARGVGRELGIAVDADAVEAFAGSVPDWPPFPDSVAALAALGTRYRLAIVSNVDDDLFAGTAKRLGVRFDEVVTAEQVGAYKPAPAHFHEALDRLGLPMGEVLHVAQSRFHDIAPAKALGLTCVWVDRRAGREGEGATPAADAHPDLVVPDLEALARAAGVA